MAVEPKRATTARKKPVVNRKKRAKKPSTDVVKVDKKPNHEARLDDLVLQLNKHLATDLEPVPAPPDPESKEKPVKVEKLTGEARVDALVASLNAQFNANLEPSDTTGR